MDPRSTTLVILTVAALFAPSGAAAQDLPRAPAAKPSATPRPTTPRPVPRAQPAPSAPTGGQTPPALVPPAPPDPPPTPPCERDLVTAARAPGRLGALVDPREGRLTVRHVVPGSLAAREGLLDGDVILGLAGHDGASLASLREELAGRAPGERLAFRILRRHGSDATPAVQSFLLPVSWSGPALDAPKDVLRCVTGRLGAVRKAAGGDTVVFHPSSPARPLPADRRGRLWWVLDEPHGGLGKGVEIALGDARRLTNTAKGSELELLSSTSVIYDGERISVPAPGKPVHFVYEDGQLL